MQVEGSANFANTATDSIAYAVLTDTAILVVRPGNTLLQQPCVACGGHSFFLQFLSLCWWRPPVATAGGRVEPLGASNGGDHKRL